MTTADPFAPDATDPINPPRPPMPVPAPATDTQLARLHTHEAAIQRVEALAGTTIEADGEKAVDAVRKSAKAVRCEIENCRKALNADALDWQRRVNDLAKRLTARVSPVEDAMQQQLDRVAREKADKIRQAQAQLHNERFAELQARHGEWGVNELRATSPLTLVGYSPEAWAALLDTLDTRRREQEIAARKRAEAESQAAKQREEAQRIAREEQAKRAEVMRLQSEQEAQAREAAKQRAFEERQRREREWEAAEEQRLNGTTCQNGMRWLTQLGALYEQHRLSAPPIGTEKQMQEIDELTKIYLQMLRLALNLYRNPFPG